MLLERNFALQAFRHLIPPDELLTPVV
jgi:hypothetical protein